MIQHKKYGVIELPSKKFAFKRLLISLPFVYMAYKWNQTKQRQIFMNKIRTRDLRIQLGFDDFQDQLKIDQQSILGTQNNYLILFSGKFEKFFPLYLNIISKVPNLQPQFIYYLDDIENYQKIQIILQKQNIQNLHIIQNKETDLKENVIYCVSPENTLIHSELIRDINYNNFYISLQVKLNKYKEKQFLSTMDFKI